jgi:hypothetical protein
MQIYIRGGSRSSRGGGMHWKSMEVDGAGGADGASSEYKVSEAVKVVRTS